MTFRPQRSFCYDACCIVVRVRVRVITMPVVQWFGLGLIMVTGTVESMVLDMAMGPVVVAYAYDRACVRLRLWVGSRVVRDEACCWPTIASALG